MLQYILPLLFLIPVLAGFFVDLQTVKGKIVLVLVLVISCALIGLNIKQLGANKADYEKKVAEAAAVETWKSGMIAKLAGIIAGKRDSVQTDSQRIADFVKFGWTSHHPLFSEALLADRERTRLMEVLPPPNNVVTIENLPNSVDKMILSWSFEELGFRVQTPQSQEFLSEKIDENKSQKKKGDKKQGEKKPKKPIPKRDKLEVANTMYYGHLVRNHDLKLIVYTMIRAGVELKMLRPMKQQTPENARSIRFDWSRNYSKRETLSVKRIRKTKRFKR